MLLHALQFDVNQTVGLFLLFVLEEEQFICSKRQLFYLVHSDSHHLSQCSAPLVVIFVDTTHLYCYSFVNAVAFLLVIFDWLISPHQVGVPCSFHFVRVILKVPSCIKSWSLMCLPFIVRWIHHYLLVGEGNPQKRISFDPFVNCNVVILVHFCVYDIFCPFIFCAAPLLHMCLFTVMPSYCCHTKVSFLYGCRQSIVVVLPKLLNREQVSQTVMKTSPKIYQCQMKICNLSLLGIEPGTSWLKDKHDRV